VQRYLPIIAAISLLLATGCLMPNREEQVAKNETRLVEEGIAALEPGQLAPAFTGTAHDGSTLSVPAGGDGRILLFFYPADMTPNTTRELQTLSGMMEELASSGISVYGMSGGTLDEHRQYAERYGISVPLLNGDGLEVAERYGCAPRDAEFIQRTLVGVNADGTVAFFERGFPLLGSPEPVLEWFAGDSVPVADDGAAADDSDGEWVPRDQRPQLPEETRRLIYAQLREAEDRAWEEARRTRPVTATDDRMAEQIREQSDLAMQLLDEYKGELAAEHEQTRRQLNDILAEGTEAGWPEET
jgi:peroxiredoxin Q/BCP